MGRRRQERYRTVWSCPGCGMPMWLSRTAGKRALDVLGCDRCGAYIRLDEVSRRQEGLRAAAFATGSAGNGAGKDGDVG